MNKEDKERVKAIPITDVIQWLGINISSSINTNKEYFISIRNEDKPSCKINPQRNMFLDFGTGAFGDNIQLVQDYLQINFQEAIQYLLQRSNNIGYTTKPQTFQHSQYSTKKEEKKKIEIKNIVELRNNKLIEYLKSRKLNIDVVKGYVNEVYFNIHKNEESSEDKIYFGIGFRNNSNNFEIRNPYMKYSTGKNITTIIEPSKSNEVINGKLYRIFEGFMDFLSFKTIENNSLFNNLQDKFQEKLKYETINIVINGVTNKYKLYELLKSHMNEESRIIYYGDNDLAGNQIYNELNSRYTDKVYDFRGIYENQKDLNECLIEEAINYDFYKFEKFDEYSILLEATKSIHYNYFKDVQKSELKNLAKNQVLSFFVGKEKEKEKVTEAEQIGLKEKENFTPEEKQILIDDNNVNSLKQQKRLQ